ncbi:MAG: GatB/YqeY domain-containing protein [Candidatus Promineifilaceae bacterium]|nr:GatB/YqeY domain-containing protein [Candidatus Promineifilaceae bacterium]
MLLKERLQEDLKEAMRADDPERRDVLRLLLAAVKQEEVDRGEQLDELGVQAVLTKQAKQRRESIADAERAGREDLVAGEERELEIIGAYLPQMMKPDEVRVVAARVIDEMSVSDMKGMGAVMSRLMPELEGRAEGRVVSAVVRELLQNA